MMPGIVGIELQKTPYPVMTLLQFQSLYRSDDGGESWHRMSALNNLESSKSWSFPPRPWTSHVRWIESDVNIPDYVFVAIEAGALVQSRDGGRTWIDRVEQGPYDTHTLGTHQKAPKRLYSSAADRYTDTLVVMMTLTNATPRIL